MFKDIDRPAKRIAQQKLTNKLIEEQPKDYVPGSMYVLSGPNPTSALQQYVDSKLAKTIILLEKDYNTFKSAITHKPKQEDIELKHGDIFKFEIDDNISGIDLDLCTSVVPVIADITILIRKIINRNKLPLFWLRITSALRKVGTKQTQQLIEESVNLALQGSDYSIKNEEIISYSDYGPMHVWQGYFVKTNKGETEMNAKKLKDLKPAEREMVRVLSDFAGENFSDSDIAKVFKLAPNTVRALKAHRTMRLK